MVSGVVACKYVSRKARKGAQRAQRVFSNEPQIYRS